MSIFEIAWSLVKAEPPNYIEDEPHDEDAYIVGPPITCPDCGDTDASMIREPSSDGGYLLLVLLVEQVVQDLNCLTQDLEIWGCMLMELLYGNIL